MAANEDVELSGSTQTAAGYATEQVTAALEATPGIVKVVHLRAAGLAEGGLLVAAKVAIEHDWPVSDASDVLASARDRIAESFSPAPCIYLEPVVRQAPTGDAPPTDVFILKSED